MLARDLAYHVIGLNTYTVSLVKDKLQESATTFDRASPLNSFCFSKKMKSISMTTDELVDLRLERLEARL